ncbi:MAG: DUF2304 domain-containing protein [candidate division KSB1 bacterium]|nr:DUF2304 domain-containing protein [candidate division KSB1 bacterium]
MNQFLDVTLRAKLIVGGIGIIFIVFLLFLLYKKKLTANFALGWIGITLLAVSAVIVPSLMKFLTRFSGVRFGALAVSLYAFVFIFAVLIIFSIKISQLSQQTRKAAQMLGILEMEIERLKKASEQKESSGHLK